MNITIIFAIFLIAGIGVNFFLFYREQSHTQNSRFLTSERLLVFIIEILIAVIGFGFTLGITDANEKRIEKEEAICMIEQTIEYTDSQVKREKSYLNMYNKEKIDGPTLLISNVISLDYYDNILSNEVILQNANMNTYGEIMRYLAWIEYFDESAKTEEDGKIIYSKLYYRYTNLQKVRELLCVCCDEMNGEITSEEALELCNEIKTDKKENADNAEDKKS